MLTTRHIDLSDARRVIIYRLGSIGDTVVSLPCFHRIAMATPRAERIVLTNAPTNPDAPTVASVLAGSRLVHGFMDYPGATRSVRALNTLRLQLRAFRPDALIYLTESRTLQVAARNAVFFRLSGCKRLIGVPLRRDLRLHRLLDAQGQVERECSRLARCLAPLGPIDVEDDSMWNLHLTPEETAVGHRLRSNFLGNPFIAINMGGKGREKDWGSDHWETLLVALTQEYPRLGLLVVGGPSDMTRARAMEAVWRHTVVIACGDLTPRQCAAAMSDAAAFVGHDSGPMHLASAVGVPCVGLFGGQSPPKRWHPVGEKHRPIHRMSGVRDIKVAEVLAAVRATLPSSVTDERPSHANSGA